MNTPSCHIYIYLWLYCNPPPGPILTPINPQRAYRYMFTLAPHDRDLLHTWALWHNTTLYLHIVYSEASVGIVPDFTIFVHGSSCKTLYLFRTPSLYYIFFYLFSVQAFPRYNRGVHVLLYCTILLLK